MPASVVIVHDHPEFLANSATVLRNAGNDVTTFQNTLAALDALEDAAAVDVLVTRVSFPRGCPNGVSLARTLRAKRPRLKVIFAARAKREPYIEELGELLPHPVDLTRLVTMVARLAVEARRDSSVDG